MTRDLSFDRVRHIASLARIRMDDAEVTAMIDDLNKIFDWIELLNEVDITGVDPLTTADMAMPMRDDVVDDGGNQSAILLNAPQASGDFFTVPKRKFRFVGDDE